MNNSNQRTRIFSSDNVLIFLDNEKLRDIAKTILKQDSENKDFEDKVSIDLPNGIADLYYKVEHMREILDESSDIVTIVKFLKM